MPEQDVTGAATSDRPAQTEPSAGNGTNAAAPRAPSSAGQVRLDPKSRVETVRYDRALDEAGRLNEDGFRGLERDLSETQRWEDLAGLYELAAQRAPDPAIGHEMMLSAGLLMFEKLGQVDRAERFFRRVLASDPQHLDTLDAYHRLCMAKGRFAEAADFLDAAIGIAADVDKPDLCLDLAKVASDKLGQADRAVAALRFAFELDSSRTEVLEKARAILTREGRYREALEVLSLEEARLLGDRPADPADERTRGLAEAYRSLGVHLSEAPLHIDLAERALNMARSLGDNDALARLDELAHLRREWEGEVERLRDGALESRDKRKAATLYIKAAELLLSLGKDPVKSDDYLKRSLILLPGSPMAIRFIERAYSSAERLPERVKKLEAIVADVRDRDVRVDILLRTARAKAQLGDIDLAIEGFRKVLEVAPENQESAHAASELLNEAGRYDEQAEVLERFVEAAEDEHQVLAAKTDLGTVYAQFLGDTARARGCFEDVLRKRPSDFHAASALRALYTDAQEKLGLIQVLGVLVEYSPDLESRLAVLRELASVAGEVRKEQAFDAYRQIFELEPNDAEVRQQLETLAEELGRFDVLAHGYARTAARTSGERSIELWVQAARLYDEKLSRSEQAIECYKQALELEPDKEELRDRLEQLLRDRNDPKALVDMLDSQLARAQDDKERVVLLAKLGSALDRDMVEPARAVDAYQKILGIDPENAIALDALKDLFERLARWPELLEVLSALDKSAANDRERAELRARRAHVLAQQLDRGEEATQIYLEVLPSLSDEPRVIEGMRTLANRGVQAVEIAEALEPLFGQRGQHARQVEMLRILIANEGEPQKKGELARKAARVLESRLSEPEKAFELYATALRVLPSDAEALESLLRVAAAASAEAEAAGVLEEVTQVEGLDSPTVSSLASALALLYDEHLDRRSDAIDAYMRAMKADAKNTAAVAALERILGATERWPEMADFLEERIAATQERPAKVDLGIRLAAIYAERIGDIEAALSALEAVLELSPNEAPALSALADLYEQKGDKAKLVETLDRMVKASDDAEVRAAADLRAADVLRAEPERTREALQRYQRVLEVRSDDAAINGLESLLSDESLRAEVGAMLEPVYEAAGRQRDLVVALESQLPGIEEAPRRRELYLRIVEIELEGLSETELAWSKLAEAARAGVLTKEDRTELVKVALAANAGEELAQLLDEESSKDPDDIELIRQLGRLYDGEVADHAKAVSAWRRLTEKNPQDEEALSALERLHGAGDDPGALARVLLDRAEAADDTQGRLAFLKRAAAIYEEAVEDPGKAAEILEDAWMVAPRDRNTLTELQRLYRGLGRKDRVAELVAAEVEATEEPKAKAEALMKLAEARNDLGDEAGAIAAYRSVLALFADHEAARLGLEAIFADKRSAEAALALEPAYRAMADWKKLVGVYECLAESSKDVAERVERLNAIRSIYEERLESPELAFSAAARAYRDAPEDDEVFAAVARLAKNTSSSEELEEILGEAAESAEPKSEARHLARTRLAMFLESLGGDLARAFLAWRSVVEEQPEDQRALEALVRLGRTVGDIPNAVWALETLAELTEDPVLKSERLRDGGRLLDGRDDEAEHACQIYERLLYYKPGDTEAIGKLDRLYTKLGKHEELERILVEASTRSERGPDLAVLLLRLGRLRMNKLHNLEGALDVLGDLISARGDGSESALEGAVATLDEFIETQADKQPLIAARAGALLEPYWAARGDGLKVVRAKGVRVAAVESPEDRRRIRKEIAEVYEKNLEQPEMAFLTLARSYQESPGEPELTAELERLAKISDIVEELADLYNDVLPSIEDEALRVRLLRRIAEIFKDEVGRPEAAAKYYERLLKAAPSEVGVLDELEGIYRGADDKRGLVSVLRRKLQAPEIEEASRRRISSEMAQILESDLGDVDAALEAFRAMTVLDPSDTGALESMAELAFRENRSDALIEALSALADLSEGSKRADYMVQLAEARLGTEDAVAAVEAFRGALEAQPQHPGAIAQLAAMLKVEGPGQVPAAATLAPVYGATGAFPEQIHCLNLQLGAAQATEARKPLLTEMAEVLESKLGRPENAFNYLCQALKEEITDEGLHARVEKLARANGLWEDLAGFYLDGVDDISDHQVAVGLRKRAAGIFENEIRDNRRAIDEFSRVLDVSPGDIDALKALERLYKAAGSFASLVEVYRRRIAQAEDTPTRALLMRELARVQAEELSDASGAIATLRRLLDLEPNDTAAMESLARLCDAEGRFSELAEILARLIETQAAAGEAGLEPKARLATLKLGSLGDPAGGLNLAREVLAADPNRSSLKDQLREQLEDALVEDDSRLALDIAQVLAEAFQAAEAWEDLVEVLRVRSQVTADPETRRSVNYEIAKVYLGPLDQPELAFTTLAQVFRDDPSDADVRASLESLAEKLLMLEELVDAYDEGLQKISRPDQRLELQVRIAELLETQVGDKERAAEAWQAVIAQRPMDEAATEALDRLNSQLGRWSALADVLEKRIELAGEDADKIYELQMRLGSVWEERLDEPAEAVKSYRRAHNAKPDEMGAMRALARALDPEEAPEELFSVLEEMASKTQDTKVLLLIIPRMAEIAAGPFGQRTRAIELWEWVLKADPAHERAHRALEELYEAEGAWSQLAAHLQRQLDVAREDVEITRLQRKLGLIKGKWLGDVDEAIASWSEILKRNPTDVEALNALKDIYRAGSRWDDLVKTLRKLIPLQVETAGVKRIRFELAEVYLRNLDRREEAIEAAKRVLDVEPHEIPELVRLEHIFVDAGAYNDAIRVMNQRAGMTEDSGAKADVLLGVAQIYEEKLGRRAGAANAYEKILETEPSSAKAYDALCGIFESTGEFRKLVELHNQRLPYVDEAEERKRLLFEIIEIQEKRLGQKDLAFMAACRAFAEAGADTSAQDVAERLAEETESWEILADVFEEQVDNVTHDRAIDLRSRLAFIYRHKLDEPAQAERQLDMVLSVRPESEQAQEQLAALLEAQGRWRDLIESLDGRIDGAEDLEARKALFARIAQIQENELSEPSEAISTWRRCLAEDPSDTKVLSELARLLRASEEWMPLIDVLERLRELAEETEPKADYGFEIAKVYEDSIQDEDRAIDAHRAVLRIDSGHVASLKALQELYAASERWDDLVEVLEKEVELQEGRVESVPLLSTIAHVKEEQFGDVEAAIDTLRRLLAIDPAHLPSLEYVEALLRRAERWPELVDTYRDHLSQLDDTEKLVSVHIDLGGVYEHQLAEPEQAQRCYEEALDVNPSSTAAVHALGALHERQGNWYNALDMLRRESSLLGSVPEAVELHHRAGRINEEMMMDRAAAKLAYGEALAIDPGYAPSLQALQTIAKDEENWPDVLRLEVLEAEHTEDRQGRADAFRRAAETALDYLDDMPKAIECYEAALSAVPQHVECARSLADLYFVTEDWERSEKLLEIVVDHIDPDEDQVELSRQYYRLAYISEKLEADERALQRYLSSYEADPSYLPTLEGLAAALLRAERWGDAQDIFQSILDRHQESLTDAEVVDLHFQLGELAMRLDNLEKAKRHFLRAVELDPHHAGTLQAFARLCERIGLYEDAYDHRSRLVDLLPDEERFDELLLQARLSRGPLKDPYRAIDAFAQARRIRPDDELVLGALAGLYKDTSQYNRAVEALEDLGRAMSDETKKRDVYLELAALHYAPERKDHTRAVEALNNALDVDPTCVDAFRHIESMLAENGQWPAIEVNYRRMIERLPKGASARARAVLWRSLGDLYRLKLKNRDGARTAYNVVLKLTPDDEDTTTVLAQLLGRRPETAAEALKLYHQLVAKAKDPAVPTRELFGLYEALGFRDRAMCALSAVVLMRVASDVEKKAYGILLKQAAPSPKRRLDDKLWRNHLFHPACRNSIADIMSVLYRGAPELFSEQKRALLLKKKEKVDPDMKRGRGGLRYFEVFRQLSAVMATGDLEHYHRPGTAAAPRLYPGDPGALVVGTQHEVFRDVSSRQIRWMLGRELTCARPEFAMVRAVMPEEIAAALEAAVRLYSRTGSGANLPIDPRLVEAWMRELSRTLSERAVKALRAPVAACIERQDLRRLKDYLEGIEHTASRAGLLMAGDVTIADRGLSEPDAIVDMSYRKRARELMLFTLSEDFFALREQLELKISSG